tara:strand:- start:1417 stop:3282 length:1866 start_codon:yes stop_codon:yes gene_type:complete
MAKDVKYINKQFDGLKADLMEYAKNYFPNTYNDFTTASPGQMFIEMAAYVGDVLSYYTDYALKENLLNYATEKKNLYNLAQSFGYKPNISVASTVGIDLFLTVPATGTGANSAPNWDYAPVLESGMIIESTRGFQFKTIEPIDFSQNTAESPTTITVSQLDGGTGQPTYYLLKKTVRAQSGEQKSTAITVGDAEKYKKIKINDNNIIGIDKVTDSDGNIWYETPYLAQDTMFQEHLNTSEFDPTTFTDTAATPYVLSLRKTSRRFITRVTADDMLEMQFGSGISDDPDVEIIPSPTNVGTNLPGSVNKLDTAFDPSNFLNTNAYGQAPSNTILTVNYSVGYGIDGNVDADDLTKISSGKVFEFPENATDNTVKTAIQDSLLITNPEPASGGKSMETTEEIRQNALAHFGTQQRAVTREDYIVKAYSMPARYGSIAKVCIDKDTVLEKSTRAVKQNPLALNMYVLGYNRLKSLTNLNSTTRKNLKTYLSQYRVLTDAINIKHGYIINIGIEFGVVVLPGRSSKETILKCISALKEMFDIEKMQFKQPIIVKDVILKLADVDGVQSVMNVDFKNLWKLSEGYSGNKYDLEAANKNGVIYPSMDPAVFEIKYPDTDIKGKAETY